MLDKYEPSVSLTYKRNPDYWDKDAVLLRHAGDADHHPVRRPVAQLKTGAIYAFGGLADIAAENVCSTRRTCRRLNMYSFVAPSNNVSLHPALRLEGQRGQEVAVARRARAPGDVDGDRPRRVHRRVRERFEVREGRPGRGAAVPHVDGLHPRRDAGPAQQGLRRQRAVLQARPHRGEEAHGGGRLRQRLRATPTTGRTSPASGRTSPSRWRSSSPSTQELGLKVTSDPIDYNLKYLPDYVTKRGQHEGIVCHARRRDLAGRRRLLRLALLVEVRRHVRRDLRRQRLRRRRRRPEGRRPDRQGEGGVRRQEAGRASWATCRSTWRRSSTPSPRPAWRRSSRWPGRR